VLSGSVNGGDITATRSSWTSWLGQRWRSVDVFDWVTFLLFAGLSMWVFALLSSKSTPNHIWTGTDGPFIGDQMQYLGWIEDSARHVLISNPFISTPSAANFLQPGIAISGGLVRLGVSPSAAYLVWKPIAVLLLFVAVRAYVRHLCAGTAARRVALVIGLFYFSPLSELSQHFHWFHSFDALTVEAVGGEMWPGLYLWGYPFTALCVAALIGALLAYERDRMSGRLRPWAPLLGLCCAWLQPWQGATFLIMIAATEIVCLLRRREMNVRLTLVTGLATVAPLAYYSILSHTDPTWVLSGKVNLVVYPWLPLLFSLAPLALVTLLAWRYPAPRFNDVAVRVWPAAALAVYCLIAVAHVGTFPSHALQGLSVPFGVLLATVGQRIPIPLGKSLRIGIVALVVALLVVPSGWREMNEARSYGTATTGGVTPTFITADEQRAFFYLKQDELPGAVLAPIELGEAVPAETGRRTWVGIYSWTPDYEDRVLAAENLFSGHLSPSAARHLVEQSDTRFLLSDCQDPADLSPVLGHLLQSRREFGCVTVYVLRS
jgi:hypothetical protein